MDVLARCTLLAAGVLIAKPAAPAHEPIRATYTTSDGAEIVGDYWTPLDTKRPAPAVILLHMYRSDRTAWHPLVAPLESAGFAILAIDLRGHGESVNPPGRKFRQRVRQRDEALFNAMYRDVAGAYRWLSHRKEVDLSRLALVGASVGCSVALDYARRDKSVDVVVLMTPGTNYLGVDSLAHVREYGGRPILMLTSAEERPRGVEPLLEQAKRSGADAQEGVYPQSGIHGTHMFGRVDGVERRIADYLKKHVNRMQGDKVYASIDGDVYYPAGSPRIKRVPPETLRVFSSAAEASKRGLKPAD